MEFGYTLVNILGALLIVTSTLVVLAKNTKRTVITYAVQSFVLVLLLLTLGITTGATELMIWSASAFVTKVIMVPAIIWHTYKKMGCPDESGVQSKLHPAISIALVAVEVLVCFWAVSGIQLPTAAEVKPALAISLAHFFVGLTCIVSQRNIMKSVFGYCLMENGSHVTLALLAPTAPEIIEIGIATDAIFAVLIMSIVVSRIWKGAHTLDSHDLTNLRG